MIDKADIIESVSELRRLAVSRDTEQGILVFDHILAQMRAASSVLDVRNALESLNSSLAGIEAHGHFTDTEFAIVRHLRSMAS